MLLLPVIVANTLIGIIQEIRSKKTLDKLSVLNAPKARVVRDGKVATVNADQLVLDDVVIFSAGNQICADAFVVQGEVQVNESLITGESDEITKRIGDPLLSGSFIVSGKCAARLDKVGADSYISKLTLEAKASKEGEQSEMIRSLDKLVQIVGLLIIPIGLILFFQQFFLGSDSVRDAVTAMVAAVIGMIPEGLYLLASVALAVSVIRLAQKKVLVHDMKCIETSGPGQRSVCGQNGNHHRKYHGSKPLRASGRLRSGLHGSSGSSAGRFFPCHRTGTISLWKQCRTISGRIQVPQPQLSPPSLLPLNIPALRSDPSPTCWAPRNLYSEERTVPIRKP